MDVLRSCYSTKCRFIEGGPEETIQWYFTNPFAVPFDTRNVFNSLNWYGPYGDPGTLGEIPGAPRSWRKGIPPYPVIGQNFCGDADWFLNGHDLLPSPVAVNHCGTPLCCSGVPPWGAGFDAANHSGGFVWWQNSLPLLWHDPGHWQGELIFGVASVHFYYYQNECCMLYLRWEGEDIPQAFIFAQDSGGQSIATFASTDARLLPIGQGTFVNS